MPLDSWEGDGSHDYKKNWVGDQKPNYDLLYRPENDMHKPPSFLPYDKNKTSSDYFVTHTVQVRPHTRWSRCLMEIEEHWDALPGYSHLIPISSAASTISYKYSLGVTSSADNVKHVIWGDVT